MQSSYEDLQPSYQEMTSTRKFKFRRNNIPRVLIRGWHTGTAATTRGLNTDRGVYPFAWHFKVLPPAAEPAPVPPPLTDLTRGEVISRSVTHISGDRRDPSVFTSWTADLPTAVFFALGDFDHSGWIVHAEPGHVAVVDPSRPPPPLPVAHAADLGWGSLPMEYLVHGPVTEGLRVVSITAIRGTLNCPLFPFCYNVPREPHPVTEEEIRDSVRVGLMFLSAADTHVDVALVIAASLLSWGQVPVRSPIPLNEADMARIRRQQTRPWPQADLDTIISSRLLVHDGAFPPLSGAALANPLTSTEAWGGRPAGGAGNNTAGASRPRLTREQWEAAFRDAAGRHTPREHECGQFVCKGCGKSRAREEPPDYSLPETLFHCSNRCAAMHDVRGAVDTAPSPWFTAQNPW
ncbi:hypothetical protein KVR01_011213 [Diaporthe batatas]|uniref:uncharacterized protein n=1 Tax=Diaporthe batatas TaxID=748121 RepID=UPI001D04E3AA|nr:uncharacterized protein KVR01_011213 [Diaporthe batatas]KAG8158770.1 hypothetical protein KVR01_011213 [Diaporthe batatas]